MKVNVKKKKQDAVPKNPFPIMEEPLVDCPWYGMDFGFNCPASSHGLCMSNGPCDGPWPDESEKDVESEEMDQRLRTGLEIIKAPDATAGELAKILAAGHPPFELSQSERKVFCDSVSCEQCWLSWLTTGRPPALPDAEV